jgi:hypothetical protein
MEFIVTTPLDKDIFYYTESTYRTDKPQTLSAMLAIIPLRTTRNNPPQVVRELGDCAL